MNLVKDLMKYTRCLVFLLSPFLFQLTAHSTTVLKLDRNELTQRANRIIIGRVQTTQSIWSQDGKSIYTLVQVSVDISIKGERNSETVLVVVPGGEVGTVGQIVSGALAFHSGEKVFLFLQEKTTGIFQIVGLFQGKYDIRQEGNPPVEYVSRGSSDSLVDPVTKQYIKPEEEKIPLADFIPEIRSYTR